MAGKGKSRRRGNGEGTISQRKSDGRWQGQVTNPETGKRRTYYGKTFEEVRLKVTEARHQLDRGRMLTSDRQTVEQYLAWWLEDRKTQGKAGATWVRDEAAVRLYLVPEFGKLTLAKFTSQPARIQAAYGRWLTEAGPQGYPIDRSTLRRVHAALSAALHQAEDLDIVPRNVARRVRVPQVERRDVVGQAWSTAQVNAFLDATREHRLGNLYAVAVTTGLRPQELIALKWTDVDLACGKVSVRAKWARQIVGYAEERRAKSRAGERTFKVPSAALAALKAQKVRLKAEKLAAGSVWREHQLVFPADDGEWLGHSRYWYWFHKLRAAAGLPHCRPYDMRHTAATMALQEGVPINDVKEMLGHSKASMTLDVYGHASPGAELAAQGIDAALEKARVRQAEHSTR